MDSPNLALEYAYDKKNNIVVYLLMIPIRILKLNYLFYNNFLVNGIEDLDSSIKMNLKIHYLPIDNSHSEIILQENKKISELIESKLEMRFNNEENLDSNDFYNRYLDIIQKNQQKKVKKDYFFVVEKRIKLIPALIITTEHYQTCSKCLILIRVKLYNFFFFYLFKKIKNNLKNIMLKDSSSFNISTFNKSRGVSNMNCYNDPQKKKNHIETDISIYLKNIEFILSNSSCKSLYNTSK